MAKIRESEEHSKSKTMEHFLSGFKPDDSDWIIFLADVFFDIFCNYNFQMISLLKHPVDAWSKVSFTHPCTSQFDIPISIDLSIKTH